VADQRETAAEAQTALGRRDFGRAFALYRHLLGYDHVVDYEYDDWLRGAAEALRNLGQSRLASFVYVYLQYFPQALQLLPPGDDTAFDVARIHELSGDHSRAAEMYAARRAWVHAGIAWEHARDLVRARGAWETILQSGLLSHDKYLEALCRVNLGLVLDKVGDAPESRKHLARASTLLEEAADAFEASRERARAFDCFQTLLRLGKELQAYENIAEGYLNSIRVLKEDNLRSYVLEFYEDFQKLSLEREEYHAAATLFREAADYAARTNQPYDGYYLLRAGETWWKVAEHGGRLGSPPELLENALLAAIDAFNALGDFARVRETFTRLAALDLSPARKQSYARKVARYADVATAPLEVFSFPDYLRRSQSYIDVWYADLVEWELDGDPERVAAAMIGNPRHPDLIRRRALSLLLARAEAGRTPADDPRLKCQMAEQLGRLTSYDVLRPLEKLFGDEDQRVRTAVVQAARQLPFKRTYDLIRRALGDDNERVREKAMESMRELHFVHAFEPLVRIYREFAGADVKAAALRTIGKIETTEAAELVLEALRQEGPELRRVAAEVLAGYRTPEIVELVRGYAAADRSEGRGVLEDVLRRMRPL
jgi:tetratricopeptide (TPR) repeat protein